MGAKTSFKDIAKNALATVDSGYGSFITFAEELQNFAAVVNGIILASDQKHAIELVVEPLSGCGTIPTVKVAIIQDTNQPNPYVELAAYKLKNGSLSCFAGGFLSRVFDREMKLDVDDPDSAKAYILALLISKAGHDAARNLVEGLSQLDTRSPPAARPAHN